MFKIALIDDKDFAISQVRKAIPKGVEYEFFYFSSYKEAIWKSFDVALIDYYLDLDGVVGEDIVHLIDAKIKIWFSTVKRCSDRIMQVGANYSILKIHDIRNNELEEVFTIIFDHDLK